MFFPLVSLASEIRLDANKVEIKMNEQFIVDVVVYADEPVNALEGKIKFSSDILDVTEIRDGNSSINFWIEKPHLASEGEIIFSGITPGGFTGVNNIIFSIVFEAKQNGLASVVVDNIKVLKNDGLGTEEKMTFNNVKIFVNKGDSNVHKEILKDEILPEPFNPIVTKDPSLFEGKYFVAFSTQDKNSGIAYYQIKEYKWKFLSFLSSFKVVESPYLLTDQSLKSYIIIRAVDNANNIQVSEIIPTYSLLWYEYFPFWIIIVIILGIVFYLFFKIWKGKRLENL